MSKEVTSSVVDIASLLVISSWEFEEGPEVVLHNNTGSRLWA